jgi:hypothetical protein
MKQHHVRPGFRILALAAVLVWAGAGCGDSPTGPLLSFGEIQGVYQPTLMSFDPQGAAPPGDVLEALGTSGLQPLLNIATNGTFQIPYRDPVTGEFRTLAGSVRLGRQEITLTFATAAGANQLALPRELTLAWGGPAEPTFQYSGPATVSRLRLQQLLPDLYGQEPWTGDTIAGTLTVLFVRVEA